MFLLTKDETPTTHFQVLPKLIVLFAGKHQSNNRFYAWNLHLFQYKMEQNNFHVKEALHQ